MAERQTVDFAVYYMYTIMEIWAGDFPRLFVYASTLFLHLRSIIKPPLAKSGASRDNADHLFVCLFVCLSVCRLKMRTQKRGFLNN